jgi:hypothetical protein
MKLAPSGLGAEPKKLAILGGLVVVLVVVYLLNRSPNSPGAVATTSGASASVANSAQRSLPPPGALANRAFDSVTPMPPQRTQAAQRSSEASIQDFKPTLKPPEGTDVSRIDPTLRLNEIAKLRTTALEGGSRSIFDFGAAPAPKLPTVAPIKPGGPVAATPAAPTTPAAPAVPAPPAFPPIPLKYYGYVDGSSGPARKAFFLHGDDIFVAGENDTVDKRYRILHISANSAIVEDTTNKHQQTLPLVEELPG